MSDSSGCLKERGTILTPTLVVFERYGRTFADKLNLTPEEKAWGNSGSDRVARCDESCRPTKLPDRIKTALANPEAVLDRIQQTYDIALKNLKTLQDAGVTIATGTDAGNIGTIHGPAIFREFQLMKEAGLTPMQILISARPRTPPKPSAAKPARRSARSRPAISPISSS